MTKQKDNKIKVGYRLSKSLIEKLKTLASNHNMTYDDVLKLALSSYNDETIEKKKEKEMLCLRIDSNSNKKIEEIAKRYNVNTTAAVESILLQFFEKNIL